MMKKVIKFISKSKGALFSVLFSVILTSGITYADSVEMPYGQELLSRSTGIYDVLFGIIGFGIYVLVLGLFALLLIKLIKAIIGEVQDIMNDIETARRKTRD